MTNEYLAIHAGSMIARGDLERVVRDTKALGADIEPIVLEVDTCKRIELDWHGDVQQVLDRLPGSTESAPNRRGRPKLGVKSKEVTLLPRHWEWLATQRGGASVTLRRLVEVAMNNATAEERISMKQNQLYSLLSVLADAPGFEEAARAMYRNSRVSFEKAIESWPEDIRALVVEKFDAINAIHQGEDHQLPD